MSHQPPSSSENTDLSPDEPFAPEIVSAEATSPEHYEIAKWLNRGLGGVALFVLFGFQEFFGSDATRPFVFLSGFIFLTSLGMYSGHRYLKSLNKTRLTHLLGRAGHDDRYPLASCSSFTIELVVARSSVWRWPRVMFHCRFHDKEALPFQFVAGEYPRQWLLHRQLTESLAPSQKDPPKYYYQGDLKRLDAAVTALVPELGTVHPKSLRDGVLVCEWLAQEKCVVKPDDHVRMELANALQKIAMMATRMAGATLPLEDLAAMMDPRHHVEYRRRAVIMLLEGYTLSADGRATLAKVPLSQWHEFAVPVAYSLGSPVDEAALEAQFQALTGARRLLFFSLLSRARLYPGSGLTGPSRLSHEFLSTWLAVLLAENDRVSVPHLIACYFEGILPPELVLSHIACLDDVRTSGFLADVVLNGPPAHAALAATALSDFDLGPRGPRRLERFPQLSDAEHNSLLVQLDLLKSRIHDLSSVQEFLDRPAHLLLAEVFAKPHHFKMLLRRLQDEDDRACIPHLIACFHLPHMRAEILTFMGREQDQRVEWFLHDVLSSGSSGEIKQAVQVLERYGSRLSLAPLQETQRRLGWVHRELIDEAIAAINQRYPAFAEAGALSPVALHADGAISLVDLATMQGAVSRIESPADKGQVSLEPTAPDGEENHRPV